MLLFMDGFDHYDGDRTRMLGNYASVDTGSYGWLLTTAQARSGTHCLMGQQLSTGGGGISQVTRYVLPEGKPAVGIGFACYFDFLPSYSTSYVFGFRDVSASPHVTISVRPTGALEVLRGAYNGTSLGVSSTVLVADTWQHVEVLTVFDDATGSVEIRVDGVTVLDVTGIDTVNTANALCSEIYFGLQQIGNAAKIYIDDLFIWDTTGSYNNTFLGDRTVATLFPNADTVEADWTPNTGSDGYAMLTTPDEDTSYLESGTTGQLAEFDLTAGTAALDDVSAVMVTVRARKTVVGSSSMDIGVNVAGTVGEANAGPLATGYNYHNVILERHPDTVSPWTPSDLDETKLRLRNTT